MRVLRRALDRMQPLFVKGGRFEKYAAEAGSDGMQAGKALIQEMSSLV